MFRRRNDTTSKKGGREEKHKWNKGRGGMNGERHIRRTVKKRGMSRRRNETTQALKHHIITENKAQPTRDPPTIDTEPTLPLKLELSLPAEIQKLINEYLFFSSPIHHAKLLINARMYGYFFAAFAYSLAH